MESADNNKKTSISNKSPDSIRTLLSSLGSKNGAVRETARHALAKIGSPAVKYIADVVESNDDKLRWEAIKTLGEIVEPITIPFLIDALEDENSSIRWLAAEGLIRLGPIVSRPLLTELIERSDSVFFLHGTHHVIYDLISDFPDEQFQSLLKTLKKTTARELAPVIATEILRKLNRKIIC